MWVKPTFLAFFMREGFVPANIPNKFSQFLKKCQKKLAEVTNGMGLLARTRSIKRPWDLSIIFSKVEDVSPFRGREFLGAWVILPHSMATSRSRQAPRELMQQSDRGQLFMMTKFWSFLPDISVLHPQKAECHFLTLRLYLIKKPISPFKSDQTLTAQYTR